MHQNESQNNEPECSKRRPESPSNLDNNTIVQAQRQHLDYRKATDRKCRQRYTAGSRSSIDWTLHTWNRRINF